MLVESLGLGRVHRQSPMLPVHVAPSQSVGLRWTPQPGVATQSKQGPPCHVWAGVEYPCGLIGRNVARPFGSDCPGLQSSKRIRADQLPFHRVIESRFRVAGLLADRSFRLPFLCGQPCPPVSGPIDRQCVNRPVRAEKLGKQVACALHLHNARRLQFGFPLTDVLVVPFLQCRRGGYGYARCDQPKARQLSVNCIGQPGQPR